MSWIVPPVVVPIVIAMLVVGCALYQTYWPVPA
jgi:hypothetical protein